MVDYQNLYKNFTFKKDIFSKNQIFLKKVKMNNNLKKIIFKLGFKEKFFLQKIISNNLNSNTYKITTTKKSYLIKIEEDKNKNKLIALSILRKNKFTKKTILPITFKKGKNYLLHDKYLITLFPFKNGNLYSGNKLELKSSINEILRLFIQLSKIKNCKDFNKFQDFKNMI